MRVFLTVRHGRAFFNHRLLSNVLRSSPLVLRSGSTTALHADLFGRLLVRLRLSTGVGREAKNDYVRLQMLPVCSVTRIPSISEADLMAVVASLASLDCVSLSWAVNPCLILQLATYNQPSSVSSTRVCAQYVFIATLSSDTQIVNGEQNAKVEYSDRQTFRMATKGVTQDGQTIERVCLLHLVSERHEIFG